MSVKSLETQIKELVDKELEKIIIQARKELEESIKELDSQLEKLKQYLKGA